MIKLMEDLNKPIVQDLGSFFPGTRVSEAN